ncbi:hypothetical protein HH212_02780 [Massilia forsythiae]|uniref:Immunity protein 72 domain-containing protein n=1 Tax=Massilia forsythiae TaxID=2728020 RepID=A0A7Z2VTB2_9BURK|nr:hypothetical protein [Massilia forsythiae]QJD99092.1 hypothetical protein HH212_02780 [Massilia forsythiae]
MRNMQLEAAVWNLFTSPAFYESAALECEEMMNWFGKLAVDREVANFGRNNQIFDTFKRMARDFRRGAELVELGDYQLIWKVSGFVAGDARGMLEQPLQSWMSQAEYKEFESIRIGKLLKFDNAINHALNNAFYGAQGFFNPNPDCPERSDDDDGFPGDGIIKRYRSVVEWYKNIRGWELPDPLPEYVIDKSISCRTGDEVPWTGVWYPATGLEKHSLTFAIKGLRMQPVYRIVKTTEELSTPEYMFPPPQTVAVETVWHPVVPSVRKAPANDELWAKAGQPCPKAGMWQPTDPGVAPRAYEAGMPMADLKSAYGITVWRWMSER